MGERNTHQRERTLKHFDKFPPTVTGHTEYEDGVDLHLLDSGTDDDPRVIHIFDDEPTKYNGLERPSA